MSIDVLAQYLQEIEAAIGICMILKANIER